MDDQIWDGRPGVTWAEYQRSVEAARTYLAGSVAGRRALAAAEGETARATERPATKQKPAKAKAGAATFPGMGADG